MIQTSATFRVVLHPGKTIALSGCSRAEAEGFIFRFNRFTSAHKLRAEILPDRTPPRTEQMI